MFKHKVALSLIALGFVLGLLLFLNWISLSQQRLVLFNLNSYRPYGLKAVDLLLKKSGYQLTEVNTLPANREKLLILLTTGELPQLKQQEFLDWVFSGGTIVELAQNNPALHPVPSKLTHLAANHPQNYSTKHKPFAGLNYHLKNKYTAVISRPGQGFYGVKKTYFIYRQQYGRGNLISWNDPDGLTNLHLKKYPDNAVIFVLLLKTYSLSKQIAFFNTGFLSPSTDFDWKIESLFNRYWGGFFLLLTGIILLLWKLATRFGRPRPVLLSQGRSFNEFVHSMAGLFQQANIQNIVFENLWRELIKIMAQITGLPVFSPMDSFVSKLAAITGQNYQDLIQLYHQSHTRDGNLPKHQFLTIARQLDNYRKEFIEWKKSNHFITR